MNESNWATVALGDVLTLRRDAVTVDQTQEYPNLGLYSFGRGAFEKDPIKGTATSASTLYRVRAGQFIYSRLFAFEGAFAVVPPEMDGWFVSNEYPTFDIRSEVALTEFLEIAICRETAWMEMAAMTVGMGHRRQRLQPAEFLAYEIELPPLDEQQRIVEAVHTIDGALDATRLLAERARLFLVALRETRLVSGGDWRRDEGWVTMTLAEVSDVRLGFTKGRKLAGPTQMLPYLRAVNVQDGFITLDDVALIEATDADLKRWALRSDDILLLEGCGSPRLVGRGWIWDGSIEPCLHQNSTLRARILDRDRVDPRFIAHALCASPARRHCYDAMEQMSVAHLGLAGASAIPIPVPPLDVQRQISREFDDSRSVLVAALQKTKQYERLGRTVVEALLAGTTSAPANLPAAALATA